MATSTLTKSRQNKAGEMNELDDMDADEI